MNGQVFIRVKLSLSAVLLFVLCFSFQSIAQNTIGVVDYMKVDDPNAYLELEKQWMKIHEERMKHDMIIGWAVYKVMFKTSEDTYNYVTISWYDGFAKLDKGIPEEIFDAAIPGRSEEEWDTFHKKTEQIRKRVSSGVFHQRLSCNSELDKEGKYHVISEISVQPGKSSREFLSMYEEIFEPLYKEDIVNNKRTSWSMWEKWPGNMKDFQYGMADGYASLDQIDDSKIMQYFDKIHPNKNSDEINDRLEEIRTLVNSEVWKLEFRLLKQ